MFYNAGYTVKKRFISNYYKTIKTLDNQKSKKRLADKLEQGYIIKSPDKNNLKEQLTQVFYLLSELYKDFPAYKQLTKEEFVKMFYKMKYIADFSMMKMAYYENELVGFFIALPNFGKVLCGKMTLTKFFKFMHLKKHAKEFVVLYVGVKKGHAGLGIAMSELIKAQVVKRKLQCIGALIQEGKATSAYFGDKIERTVTYELLQKTLQN